MNQELLKQSIAIFDTQDKWDALFEIHNQSPNIINYWLTIGGRALRESFADDSVWGCEKWGNETDIRWYLKEFGKESVGIGFGWPEIGLHLHLIDSPTYGYGRAAELLGSPVFKPLLELFELQRPHRYASEGGLAYNTTINPFSGAADTQVRKRELAWLAAHKTEDYVRKMGEIIRRLTDDARHTGLFREFNHQIQESTRATQPGQV
jgi:hypothetical protein